MITATDVVMDALGKFGESEATAVLVIWTDTDGNIQASGNANKTMIIGMCEVVKDSTLKGMEQKQ